jgi:hypothetical protein
MFHRARVEKELKDDRSLVVILINWDIQYSNSMGFMYVDEVGANSIISYCLVLRTSVRSSQTDFKPGIAKKSPPFDFDID